MGEKKRGEKGSERKREEIKREKVEWKSDFALTLLLHTKMYEGR